MAALVTHRVLHVGKTQVPSVLGSVYISKRNASLDNSNLAHYKRGRGGRSSFSGIVATVFGASGFVGRYVVNRLGKIGSQIIVPYRGDPYVVRPLKLCGDLGQVLFLPYHLEDEESIRKAMKYSNVVINMVGRDSPTMNFSFKDVHIEGARRLARIAKESGVEKFLHFSSLNATLEPQPFYTYGGSQFLKTKYLGEEAVRSEFPEAIIFRPADIFGQEDRFLGYYMNSMRRSLKTVPMWRKGADTIKQPVFVSDIATGVVNAIQDEDAMGQTFDCIGPHRYYLNDLVNYFYRCCRWPEIKISDPLFHPGFKVKTMLDMFIKRTNPTLHTDRFEREFITDQPTGLPTLEDLGVKLTNLEDRANWELKPHRQQSYYLESVGEFPDAEPPPRAETPLDSTVTIQHT